MLDFLFRRFKPPSVLDPTLGDRLAKVIYDEAKRGKVDTVLSECTLLRERQWDQRAFYAELAAKHLADRQSLTRLPDNPLGNIINGIYNLHDAWEARGGGRASTVSDQGWSLFFERLDMARTCLLRAAEQDPKDPTPFAFLQPVAMGLQLDRATSDFWFEKALENDPFNQQAHLRKLILLCEKWGGSHEEMYTFARYTLKRLPETSTLHFLLYVAFQERFLYFLSFEKDLEGAKAFINDQNVRSESIEVYKRAFRKRQMIENVSDYTPHNFVAWWFLTLGTRQVVRQETKKIGPNFTEYPWGFFHKDPAMGYRRALQC